MPKEMPTDGQKLRVVTDGTPENTRLFHGDERVGGLISFDLHPIQRDSVPTATIVVYLAAGFER